MNYYLAIDIGASSGRHILGWLEDGKLKTEEVYRFSNGAEISGGSLIWNTERLFSEVVAGLKRARELGKTPSYIGIDTWAVDYALLDKDGELIGNIFAYRDGRTEEAVKGVHPLISFKQLYDRTGIQFQPFNTVYQLYADKTSGKLEKAESMLMLPDYLNYRLTGVKKQEYTNATSTGMVNAETHNWDWNILEILGYNKNLFGELSLPGTVVGGLTVDIQREIGYDATVILPATHDTASAVLAAPLSGESPYVSSGTWSLLGIEQATARTDEGSRKANYSNEGSIDFKFRYQKNIMGLWIIQQVRKELKNKYSFAELAALAENNVTEKVIDVNSPRYLAPESMTEAIYGEAGKMNAGETAYCVFNSLAKSYAGAIAELERNTGKKYETLNIIGGGAKNGLLNRLTALATGKKVITGPVEATAIGNIIMLAIGTGEIKNLQEARKIVKNSFEVNEI